MNWFLIREESRRKPFVVNEELSTTLVHLLLGLDFVLYCNFHCIYCNFHQTQRLNRQTCVLATFASVNQTEQLHKDQTIFRSWFPNELLETYFVQNLISFSMTQKEKMGSRATFTLKRTYFFLNFWTKKCRKVRIVQKRKGNKLQMPYSQDTFILIHELI